MLSMMAMMPVRISTSMKTLTTPLVNSSWRALTSLMIRTRMEPAVRWSKKLNERYCTWRKSCSRMSRSTLWPTQLVSWMRTPAVTHQMK